MRARDLLLKGCLISLLAAGGAAAHDDGGTPDDPSDDQPAAFVESWRDNFVPFFDLGDPRSRYDSDPSNDQSRENDDTRYHVHRQRDEVTTTGEAGEVGDGCPGGYCISAGDENGDYVRFDHLLSVFTDGNGIPPFGGAAVQGRDHNWVALEAFGAGAKIDFGPSKDLTEETTGRKTFSLGENFMNPTITTDDQPEDVASRPAPTQFSVANSADHSWLALAHSPDDHGPGEFDQHDTHGGTVWADVYLPNNEDHQVRDSNAGVFILDHLGCTFGCLDEYHQFYADPERLIFQVGEIPNQAEFVGRDPDRYVFGFGSYDDGTPQNLNPTVQPVTNPVFDATNPVVDPVVSSATGVDGDGDAQGRSPCCAADPNQAGHFCNRNAGGSVMGIVEDQVGGGCIDIDEQNCVGGAVGADGVFRGCVVVNGEATVEGGESCTAAAVAGCCSDPDNAACM